MNTTVTMSPAVYNKAVRLAMKQNLSVDDYISQMVELEFYVPKSEKETTQQSLFSLNELCDMWQDTASGKSYDQIRKEYIKEKFGV